MFTHDCDACTPLGSWNSHDRWPVIAGLTRAGEKAAAILDDPPVNRVVDRKADTMDEDDYRYDDDGKFYYEDDYYEERDTLPYGEGGE